MVSGGRVQLSQWPHGVNAPAVEDVHEDRESDEEAEKYLESTYQRD
jgi:hypothetical protein